MCLQPYGYMISFYNIQIIYVVQITTQCVCYMISVNNFCIYQLLRKSDFGLIPMNFQSHTHQIMVM